MDKKKKIWLAYLVGLVITAAYTIFTPVLPFLIEDLGGDQSQVGVVIAMAPLATLLFSPIFGSLADRLGRKFAILLGLVGIACWVLLFALAQSMWFLYAGALIGGMLSSGAVAASIAFVTDLTNEEERGGYITKLQALQLLGALFAPMASGFMAEISLSLPFFVMVGFSVISLLLCWLLMPESLTKEQMDKAKAKSESPIKAALGSYGQLFGFLKTDVGPFVIFAFLISFPGGIFETITPLMVTELDLTTSQSGLIYSIGTLAMVLGQVLFVERMMKKLGGFKTIAFSMLAIAVIYVIFPFSTGFWTMLVSYAFILLFNAPPRPAVITLMQNNADESVRGLSHIGVSMPTSLGRFIGPILGGVLYSAIGAFATMVIAAILFVISAVYILRTGKKPVYSN